MCESLSFEFEENIQFNPSDNIRYNWLKSTNFIEWFNQEVGQHDRVVIIFLNFESAVRPIGVMLIDIDEGWQSCTKRYNEYTN